MRVPVPLAVIVGVLLGGVAVPYGVRRERPAKLAFEYVPPPGFAEATGEARRQLTRGQLPPTPDKDSLLPVAEADQHPDRQAWVAAPKVPGQPPPRIVLVQNPSHAAFDDAALRRIANETAEHQRGQGLDYTLTRERLVTRSDGAPVGLVAWDVRSSSSSTQATILPRHAIQLSFPDSDGIAIVTAQYLAVDEATYGPAVEASIDAARGVSSRPPPLALWLRAALAIAGGLAGLWLARLTRSKA